MLLLYRSLGDRDMEQESEEKVAQLLVEMELVCGVCMGAIGDPPEQLDTLPCWHIVHNRYQSIALKYTAIYL